MNLLDYTTVTDKEIFLLNLRGEDVVFDNVSNEGFPSFFRTCMKLGLMNFLRQKEYRGTLASFRVVRPFHFYTKLERDSIYGRTMITLFPKDILNITEILMAHDYYREPDPENMRQLHELHFDFATSHREASYAVFNYEM